MRAASDQPSSYLYRTSWRSRLIAGGLSAVLVALLLLMLVQLGVLPVGPALQPAMTMLNIQPPPPKPVTPAPKTIKVRHAEKAAAAPPVHAKTPPPKVPPVPWNVIPMSSEQFAASDISKMAHGVKGNAEGAAAQGNGQAGDGQGKGEGGGDELYDVDWYTRPTPAQTQPYLDQYVTKSQGAIPAGWGEIKCHMIDHYHVEDCQELAESPPGSGFSRALREAAWQFLVRPPRINGKPLLGCCVRIRFDFHAVRKDGSGDSDSGR